MKLRYVSKQFNRNRCPFCREELEKAPYGLLCRKEVIWFCQRPNDKTLILHRVVVPVQIEPSLVGVGYVGTERRVWRKRNQVKIEFINEYGRRAWEYCQQVDMAIRNDLPLTSPAEPVQGKEKAL